MNPNVIVHELALPSCDVQSKIPCGFCDSAITITKYIFSIANKTPVSSCQRMPMCMRSYLLTDIIRFAYKQAAPSALMYLDFTIT